jgi:outer membrane lipoprotein-sorting protein
MKRMACVAWLAALALPLTAAAEDLSVIQKKIADAWSGTKSISAKVTKKLEQNMPNGNRMRSDGTGTYEMLREGDKVKFRMEATVDTGVKIKDSEKDFKISSSSLVIDDGEYLYNMQTQMGKPNASREKSDTAKRDPAANDRKAMFETLAKENDVKALPDERVSGVDCYRIEATAKSARGAGLPAKSIFAFAKESGMLMQVKNFNDKGEDIGFETYSDVKINEKIDPQRFVFKAPDGVTVKERGAAPAPGAGGSHPPTSAPKPPTSAPATPTPPAKP